MSQPTLLLLEARIRKILLGIDKYFAGVSTLTLAGKAYAPADLKKLFQAVLDALTAAQALRDQLHQAVLAVRQLRATMNPVVRALRAQLAGTYGETSEALVDFGFTPKKTGTPDTETKAKALVKRTATRKARHILGRRQRAEITAPAVTPETGNASSTAAKLPQNATS